MLVIAFRQREGSSAIIVGASIGLGVMDSVKKCTSDMLKRMGDGRLLELFIPPLCMRCEAWACMTHDVLCFGMKKSLNYEMAMAHRRWCLPSHIRDHESRQICRIARQAKLKS